MTDPMVIGAPISISKEDFEKQMAAHLKKQIEDCDKQFLKEIMEEGGLSEKEAKQVKKLTADLTAIIRKMKDKTFMMTYMASMVADVFPIKDQIVMQKIMDVTITSNLTSMQRQRPDALMQTVSSLVMQQLNANGPKAVDRMVR